MNTKEAWDWLGLSHGSIPAPITVTGNRMTPINLDGVTFPTMWAEKGLSCKPLQKCRFKWGRHSSSKKEDYYYQRGEITLEKIKQVSIFSLQAFISQYTLC